MYIFWVFCIILLLIYSVSWYYFKSTTWCRSQTCLVGKTAIITGASSGIGYETALNFAKRGARVIMACREQYKSDYFKNKIIEETGNENVVVKIIELASFASVRAFAKDILETEERLDILVNNAGVLGIGEEQSEDGLLWVMQVNHFSSFLLTNLLIGLLKKSAPSRIINVSSKYAKHAKFDIENLNKSTTHSNNYACSKVCNILFTMELAEKLKGTNVSTFSLHPGTIETDIWRYVTGFLRAFIHIITSLSIWKTCEEGAQTSIYTSVAKGIEKYTGQHFDECKRVEPYAIVTKPGLSSRLWELSQEFTNLQPEEMQI